VRYREIPVESDWWGRLFIYVAISRTRIYLNASTKIRPSNSLTPQMASWSSFPRDIRLHILTQFTADVIADLTGLGHLLGDSAERGILDLSLRRLDRASWPAKPKPLKSLVSILTTCREFHYVISEEVRFACSPSSLVYIKACQVRQ
jgi:hypothetical protein